MKSLINAVIFFFLCTVTSFGQENFKVIRVIDLQNNFSGKYVVLEKQSIQIDKTNFPMDNDNFFFLRYLYKGEEINKKLTYSGEAF